MSFYFSTQNEDSVKIQQKFYNDFYALRLKASIEDCIVKVDCESKVIYCDSTNVQVPFSRLLHRIKSLLSRYGVSEVISCYCDPLPLLQISFDQPEDIKRFLLHIKELSQHIWLLIWDTLTTEAKNVGSQLLKSEKDDPNDVDELRLQHMFQSDSNSQLQLLHFSPDYTYKEVKIVHVTLANYETVIQMASTSVVFDVQSAIDSFTNDKSSQTVKEHVSLSDLQSELEGLTNWFHAGIAAKMSLSMLMNIFSNFRHRGACLSQLLSLWYSKNTDMHNQSQLTWTKVAKLMVTIGKLSVANYLVQHYELPMRSFEPLNIDSNSAHGRLLSDPILQDSLKSLSEIEEQIIEKTKLLILYNQQRRALEISVENLTKEMSNTIDDARYVLRMKTNARNETEKITKNIQALKDALKFFGYEQEFANDEEVEISFEAEDSSKMQLCKMLNELIASKMSQKEDRDLAVTRLNSLLPQLKVNYEQLIKEHDLLISKNHQIYQLQLSIDLSQADCLTHELKIDHFLQEQVAIKTNSDAKVLQIQREVIQVEMAEKNSQLASLSDELTSNSIETVFETQESSKKVTSNVLEWMDDMEKKIKLVSEFDELELNDERLKLLIEKAEETTSLHKSLLKSKMDSWNLEKAHKITGVEGKILQQLLENLMEEEKEPIEDHIDSSILEDTSEHYSSSVVECHLLSNETVYININTTVNLIISVDEKMKLNPKKQSYVAEIKALADDSCITRVLTFRSSALTAVFQPMIRGRHQLQLKTINNKSLKGHKPYYIYVNQDPIMLGDPVRVIKGLNYPYNIHIIPNSSTMLVSECKNYCVTLMDKSTGKRQQTIGGPTSIKLPNGVTTDSKGLVYVIDSGNHCVNTYTLEGVLLKKQGSKGEGYTNFYYPYGIGISPQNSTVYICDHNNDRVQIFSQDMKFQKAFYAVTPYDVAFDKEGHVYVTDHCNHLVAVFNESLKCINSIAGKGKNEGKLLEPRGIALDEQGYIYVVEEMNCRVSIFDKAGSFVASFGQEGNQPGEFNCPEGITIDEDGYVYVCDMLNNRVQVF